MKLSINSDVLYLNSHFFPTSSGKFLALTDLLSEDHLEDFASTSFDDISRCHWLGEVT